METATFANGCFWCTEAIFQRIKGVNKVESGYSGGETPNPTYEEVCSGTTGYAEAIQIEFDPKIITYSDLVYIFFKTHDPTTLNRQGNDVGTQYRSAIFYHDDNQRLVAEKLKNELDNQKVFENPIVTEITAYRNFYPAEDYHKNFYQRNKSHPYCQAIIDPKVTKFLSEFSSQTK